MGKNLKVNIFVTEEQEKEIRNLEKKVFPKYTKKSDARTLAMIAGYKTLLEEGYQLETEVIKSRMSVIYNEVRINQRISQAFLELFLTSLIDTTKNDKGEILGMVQKLMDNPKTSNVVEEFRGTNKFILFNSKKKKAIRKSKEKNED